MSTTKELLTGYGEEKENASIRKQAMLTCESKTWEESQLLTSKEILVEVEHVKAHRTDKDKTEMSHFEKFVIEGNEKADELAKAGAMLEGGFMAEARAKTVQQEREDVCAALQHAASFHCFVEEWKECEELKPKPKEHGFSWIRKGRKRSIERSGVLRPTGIDV